LKALDFKSLINLKSLNINKNKFINLRELPASLESLYCNNNRIKELDLDGIDCLKILHCQNNDMITISNYQNTITDLKMDNHSNLNYEDNESMYEMNQSIEVTEAIKEFYKLKNKYEK